MFSNGTWIAGVGWTFGLWALRDPRDAEARDVEAASGETFRERAGHAAAVIAMTTSDSTTIGAPRIGRG